MATINSILGKIRKQKIGILAEDETKQVIEAICKENKLSMSNNFFLLADVFLYGYMRGKEEAKKTCKGASV